MSLPLNPISPPLGNFSAWQQPFWERISAGHHTDLLNFEQECTHTKTRIYRKIQTCKRSVSHARAIMCIIPDIQCVWACRTLERLRPSPRNPTTHISTSLLWCLWPTTHAHILQHWHPLHIRTPSVSQSHTHSSSITLNILQYSKAEIPWYSTAQLSVRHCNGACVCVHTVHSTIAIVPQAHKATKFNLVMISCN